MKENSEIHQTFELEEATIVEIQAALQSGTITSKELVRLYIERIDKYDRNNPAINSIIEINPEALNIAEELDKNRKGNEGLLYGIPILLKDNIGTADKMHTSAGSIALADNIPEEDAFLVQKLRKSGVIILGKTNMSEFANFISFKLPNGYSSRGGQVLNPYGPGKFDVGGSSSGAGASIAANFAAAAIGTETSGPIISPASSNSLVGVKPTLGLVSRTGIIPLAHSQDTAGPMTRTVADAAVLLSVISGNDPEDDVMGGTPEFKKEDYTKHLDKNGLKGARIGIDRNAFEFLEEGETKVIEQAVENLKKQGAVIIDPIEVPQLEYKMDVLLHEFKHDLNAYLKDVAKHVPVSSLADIITFHKEDESNRIPYGQDILEKSQSSSDDPLDPAYLEQRRKEFVYAGEKGIDLTMDEYGLTAILTPNSLGTDMPAKAGYPSITVPAGYTQSGKPVGITFSASAYSEPTLIRLAYAYEQATKHRIAPRLD